MILGATGVLAVVMVALALQSGVEYFFATLALVGILKVNTGVGEWDKSVRLVPYPMMLVIVFGLDVPRAGDLSSIKSIFSSFYNPLGENFGLWGAPMALFKLKAWEITLPYALTLAAIDQIESLLTLTLVSEIVCLRGGASQERIAQGLANTLTGFFCAMTDQFMTNCHIPEGSMAVS